jgi:hypothetical protein
MKSKFRYPAYFVGLGSVLAAFSFVRFFIEYVLKSSTPILIFVPICVFFFFVCWCFFWGEIRAKIVSVEIDEGKILVKRYIGLGATHVYPIECITGFNTSVLHSKGNTYEYLYLMIDNKKIAKLSEFYHSNYRDLKMYILTSGIDNLGFKRYSNREEFKDLFSK